MPQLTTRRLVLVAATPDLIRAELHDRARLRELLGAEVPSAWPPPLNDEESMTWVARLLEADPGAVGWALWYFLRADPPGGARTAIGTGGFKGRPTADGTAEVGYSVVEAYQRQGYASEAVEALVGWAFAHPQVQRVVAHTLPELLPSIRLLEKCGFRFVGPGTEEGAILFERPRAG